MTDTRIEENKPVVPKTLDEALKLGFKPITDIEAFLTEHHPGLLHRSHPHLMATEGPVDCSDPANAGKQCRQVLDEHNNAVVIGFCFNGTCYYTAR